MDKIRITIAAMIFLALSSCNSHSNAKTEEKVETAQKTINIKVADLGSNQDLSCGMKLEDGHVADTASYQGKTYGFCSPECKSEFLKDPQSHLTQK